jgi:hypothetical protein
MPAWLQGKQKAKSGKQKAIVAIKNAGFAPFIRCNSFLLSAFRFPLLAWMPHLLYLPFDL